MEIFTTGFTKKTAAEFFGTIRQAGIKRLIDVRLHNSSQLAGFTKREDLPFFLREMCQAQYLHEPLLAPSQDMLYAYKKQKVLLCSEATAEHCHRRLVLEYLQDKWGDLKITHL